VVQLAHRNGVFKKFALDSRRQIVPLHDDCGRPDTAKYAPLPWRGKSCRLELFAVRPLQRRPRYPILRGHWPCSGVCVCGQASLALSSYTNLRVELSSVDGMPQCHEAGPVTVRRDADGMSACGTKRTFRSRSAVSAFGGGNRNQHVNAMAADLPQK
jgi:hypothetical protein